jgi:hypothetical protein
MILVELLSAIYVVQDFITSDMQSVAQSLFHCRDKVKGGAMPRLRLGLGEDRAVGYHLERLTRNRIDINLKQLASESIRVLVRPKMLA